MVLRKIFGPVTEEVTAALRRLHNEKLHSLYLLLYVTNLFRSSKMKCVLHVACVVEMMFAYKILLWGTSGEEIT